MQRITLLVLAAIVTMALAEGQYYVPRAYYVIDAEGHVSAPVPLRRLRRSLGPYPYPYNGGSGASANANANANAESQWGGSATANANARADAGGWNYPSGFNYGSAGPQGLSAGETRRQYGPVQGRAVSAGSSIGVDSSGKGYYDQYTSVSS
ncbi:uncharacterized protein LOC123656713 [Melitaea cinxia]|uniref:uncharacterized protein LOC123656713 n=1 Tax=Melitaea cinxia TaxID=113334 RepID=UPI001E2710BB|nr:uncharacterized protein LOC123656713 [Melitaea cinxia]